jgi:hypothetical protein
MEEAGRTRVLGQNINKNNLGESSNHGRRIKTEKIMEIINKG